MFSLQEARHLVAGKFFWTLASLVVFRGCGLVSKDCFMRQCKSGLEFCLFGTPFPG